MYAIRSYYGYSPPVIEPGRLTVAALLRAQGYATACLGKWHLVITSYSIHYTKLYEEFRSAKSKYYSAASLVFMLMFLNKQAGLNILSENTGE